MEQLQNVAAILQKLNAAKTNKVLEACSVV